MVLSDAALPHVTSRLRLRRFKGADLDRFQAYRCDPSVGRYQGWSAMDDITAAAFIDAMAAARFGRPDEWFQIAVAGKLDDALVGDIGVCLRGDPARTAKLGFTIALAAQGRGLGTEAVMGMLSLLFDSGVVERVESITDTRNVPSIGLLERVGMTLLRTQDAEFKGERCAERVYSVARPAWSMRSGSR